jgi:drug/metabolite transporter (DMT)-like permease
MKIIMKCAYLLLLLSQVSSFSSPGIIATSRKVTPSLLILKSTSTDEKLATHVSASSGTEDNDGVLQNEGLASTSTEASSEEPTTTSDPDLPDWFEPVAWRGVILVLCVLWASNFAAAKLVMGVPGVDSSLYAVARFGVAVTALAPGALGALKRANMDSKTIKGAVICGSWVAFGYMGQTIGLLTTTASRSCVICSMHCVFVAVVAEFWRVSRSQVPTDYNVSRLFPAALAVLGVAIVELQGAGGAPTIGDALSFTQPIGFGMGYLTLEELMSKKPEAALPVSAIKLSVVALASLGLFELTPLFNGASDFALAVPDFGPILSSPLALGGILYTGLVTTAFALWIESIAFAKVPATDASIILTTEPLIAAGFGAIALGETFGNSDYIGASLIVGACAVAVLLDNPQHGGDNCEIDVDEDCDEERKWPFWGF